MRYVIHRLHYRVIFHSGFMWYLGVKNSILIALLTIAKRHMALIWYLILTQPQTIIYIYLVYKVIIKMDL